MKNTIKFLGIIAIVAIIGFSMAGCKDSEEDLDVTLLYGTWRDDKRGNTLTFNENGTFIAGSWNGTFRVTGSSRLYLTFSNRPNEELGNTIELKDNNNTLIIEDNTMNNNFYGTYTRQ